MSKNHSANAAWFALAKQFGAGSFPLSPRITGPALHGPKTVHGEIFSVKAWNLAIGECA